MDIDIDIDIGAGAMRMIVVVWTVDGNAMVVARDACGCARTARGGRRRCPEGRWRIETSSEAAELERALNSRFSIGVRVRASVVGVKTSKKRIDLSLRTDDGAGSSRVCVGAKVQGIVTRVAKNVGLMVQLGSHSVGRVHLTDMADELRDDPCSSYDVGQAIQVRILHVSSNGEVDLSLRESRLGNKRKKAMDPEIEDIATLVPGERVKGYVKSTSKKGCFVSLSRRVDAMFGSHSCSPRGTSRAGLKLSLIHI